MIALPFCVLCLCVRTLCTDRISKGRKQNEFTTDLRIEGDREEECVCVCVRNVLVRHR